MNKKSKVVKTLVTVGLQLAMIGSVLSTSSALATAQESDKIANAMSAGPPAITAGATILDWPSDPAGEMIVLREGSNGWTCYTDWPATPGNDPMCLDPVWVAWQDAFMLGEAPHVTRPGLGYMLAGGSAASNTDPFAMEPAPGEDWMSSPPHVMFLYPDSVDLSQFTTDPTHGEPYIMWGGTPYEHIMMPVAMDDAFSDVEKAIANAMSAGPAALTAEATILDWPSDPAGDMIVLREGNNGWTCYTDWPATPGNDPMCLDQVWVAWQDAFMLGEAPHVTRLGFGYMLAGGSAASNTDPFAVEPAPGEDWMSSPPHVMFLYPDSVDLSQYTTDPTLGEPYVMWAGTPYEHIMMPVVVDDAASDVQKAIANAMSAGPPAITAEATILDWPSDPAGEMIVLREGSNGWTCYTDWPATPGNDPMCLDPVWVAWQDAFVLGETPHVTSPGVAYMLAGGSAASNTDPFAMEPAPGEDWMSSPPHVMLLYPDSVDLGQFTTDPTSGEPYVMWAGTPYEHIMMPVP